MKSKRSKSFARAVGLQKGDSVSLIRPAGLLELEKFEQTCQWVREYGFYVATYPGTFKPDSYFASDDLSRAQEWAWAFSQPGIRGVFSCRAGYGSMRMLAELQKMKFKGFHSKIFTGYSDVTFLHQWILNRFGHLSFHSPLMGHLEKEDLFYFLDQLCELADRPSREKWDEVEILQKGKAKGLLLGGNLSLLQVAGPAALPMTPMILAIEDVKEDYYRMDRMLWTLIHAGYSKWVKGILIGNLEGCGRDRERFGFEKVIDTLKKLTTGPIWSGAAFGHGLTRQRILPLGLATEMDAKTLHFKQAMVSRR